VTVWYYLYRLMSDGFYVSLDGEDFKFSNITQFFSTPDLLDVYHITTVELEKM
jgi:hypothetical protein